MNHLNRGGSAETGRRKSMLKVMFIKYIFLQINSKLCYAPYNRSIIFSNICIVYIHIQVRLSLENLLIIEYRVRSSELKLNSTQLSCHLSTYLFNYLAQFYTILLSILILCLSIQPTEGSLDDTKLGVPGTGAVKEELEEVSGWRIMKSNGKEWPYIIVGLLGDLHLYSNKRYSTLDEE